jgi:hypothetical protein
MIEHGILPFIRSLLALGWCWMMGAAIVTLVRPRLGRLEFHATAMLVGIGAVALELFGFGWLGLPWSASLLVAAYLPLAATAVIAAFRRGPSPTAEGSGAAGARPDQRGRCAQVTLMIAFGTLVFLMTTKATLLPSGLWTNPDAYSFYLLKSRIFHIDRGITPYFEDQENLLYTVPDHPILTVLLVNWIYLSVGTICEECAALVNMTFLLSIAILLYAFARSLGLQASIASMLAVLLGLSLLHYITLVGYTDLAVGSYLLLAVQFTLKWMRSGNVRYALLGGIGLGLAGWVKNEGVAMYYMSIGSLILAVTCDRIWGLKMRLSVRGCAVLMTLPYVLLLPWRLLKEQHGVEVIQGNLGSLTGRSDPLALLYEVVGPLAGWMVLRAGASWHVLLLLVMGLLVWRMGVDRRVPRDEETEHGRRRFRSMLGPLGVQGQPAEIYAVSLLLAILAGYVVGMLTSYDTVESLIRHVTPRLISQVTPLFYVILTYELSVTLTRPALNGDLALTGTGAQGRSRRWHG